MVKKHKKKIQWTPTFIHSNLPYKIIKAERREVITKEKLKELCKLCEKEDIEQGYLGCPFRHISSDYCRLYELIIDELEKED